MYSESVYKLQTDSAARDEEDGLGVHQRWQPIEMELRGKGREKIDNQSTGPMNCLTHFLRNLYASDVRILNWLIVCYIVLTCKGLGRLIRYFANIP